MSASLFTRPVGNMPPQALSLPRSAILRSRAPISITCMAHPRRVQQVARQIEREVGSLLIYDKILQQAICPERRRGMDNALSALASVTDVQISNDLQVAKVYLSIYSDDIGKATAMVGLQKLEGYVRKHVGRQIKLRLTPEIRFVMDDSIERTERVLKLLEQVKKIEAGEAPLPPVAIADDSDDEYEEESADGAWAAQNGAVDLGFYGSESEDEAAEEKKEKSRGALSRNKKAPPAAAAGVDAKGGDVDMTPEEVEEMMAMFGQQGSGSSNSKSGGGAARGGRGGGGKRK